MDQVNLYLRKLIILLISALLYFFLSEITGILISVSLASLVLSFLYYKISGEKPAFLFGMFKADEFINKKSGFWLLFKVLVTLVGLLYDLLIWTINGIYVFFLIFIDFLLLVKTLVFWILHAVIWFLSLFVPPLVFIYRMILHYLLKWPWWIYKLSWRNTSFSLNRNTFYIALWGAVPAIFLVSLFYGSGILLGVPGPVYIGVVFAMLPIAWAYTEISALRLQNRMLDDYASVRLKFGEGFRTVRALLFYLIIFLIAILTQIIFYSLGWIPAAGLSLLGISLNINTLISLLLVFVFVILVFAKVLLPVHMVYNPEFETNTSGSIKFLSVIGKKFLRYLFVHVPAGFFGILLGIIPLIIVGIAVILSLQLKNSVMETRIGILTDRLGMVTGAEKYETENQIRSLEYFMEFPFNVRNGFTDMKEYRQKADLMDKNVSALRQEMEKYAIIFRNEADSLREEQKMLELAGDSLSLLKAASLGRLTGIRETGYKEWNERNLNKIAGMESSGKYASGMVWQLPVAFLFTSVWLAFFGGLILAMVVSYLGNVYFELYSFRENNKPTFFREVTEQLNKKDRNQPLLGFTLFILLSLLAWIWFSGNLSQIIAVIK